MKIIWPFAFLMVGCQHIRTTAEPPLAANPSALVPVAASHRDEPEIPGEYEEYYVGMIADRENPTFAYRPGSFVVQARPPRHRLMDEQGMARGPALSANQANFHPDPTETELAALVTHSQRAISALTEENERLLAQLEDLQKAAASPAAAPAGSPTSVNTSEPEARNVIRPNHENVIELDPNFFITPSPTTNNPFVQLYQPPVSFREVSLVVSAAIPGPHPTAILNDEPYSVGDRFEGLTVQRVEPDSVYLQKDSFLLACPVAEKPVKLRLP